MNKPFLAYVKPEHLKTEADVISFFKEASKEPDPGFQEYATKVIKQARDRIDRELLAEGNSWYSDTQLAEINT